MNAFSKTGMVLAALTLGLNAAGSAAAQSVPKTWNYEIKDGKRVPKANRVTNPDGSWREEVRVGNCVTIKERTRDGEVKVTRRCD